MATMTVRPSRLRVQPASGTALPGDERQIVDLSQAPADRPSAGASVGRSRPERDGSVTAEVVVDGWRFELAVEDADRAELRERATRASDEVATSGPTEIRAMIPGRVATVRVQPGETIEAGQSLMVVEAMKMQNELRAPRAGVVRSVDVVGGQTIELGDVLVVLE